MRIEFVIPSIPVAKGRPRFTRRGPFPRAYTPEKTETAENDLVVLAAKHAPPMPFAGAVLIDIQFVLRIPKSFSKKKRAAAISGDLRPITTPDLDNLEKLVLDALTRSGQWWRNDSQIVDSHPRKVYGEVPSTRIAVTFLGWVGEPCSP